MANRERSTWQDVLVPTFPRLAENHTAEVAVIGGGMAGLLTAYLLARENKKVVLLEKNRLAQGATGWTTAFITQVADTDVSDLIDIFGIEGARLIWESHGAASALIESIAKEEGIECEFVRCPNYMYATTGGQRRDLEEEYKAMRHAGFPVQKVAPAKLAFNHRGAIAIPRQAKFHPLKFLEGIVGALQSMQVPIFERTEVLEMSGEVPFLLQAGGHTVQAPWVVTATYHPWNNPKEVLLKKGMYITYIVEHEVPRGKYPEGIYEDMDNPYHYFRVDRGAGRGGKDRVLLGGEDHRKEIPVRKASFEGLLDYSEELFGKRYPVLRKWSGPIEEPIDGLALIGQYEPHQLIATAFSGNGMTYGMLSALMFRGIILGKRTPWEEIYAPGRMPTFKQLWKKGRDYGEEFFRGAVKNALGL